MLNKTLVFVVGPPASGKSTYAKRRTKESGGVYIGIGELVRGMIEAGTMTRGDIKGFFAPEEKVRYALIDKVFSSLEKKDLVVIDNFPRTFDQMMFINTAFPGVDKELIIFDVPVEELLSRIKERQREDDTEERIRQGVAETRDLLKSLTEFPHLTYSFNSIVHANYNEERY